MKPRSNHKLRFPNAKSLVCAALVVAQIVVVLGSWVWAAVMPETCVGSVVGSGGIRWFFGTFVANLANPLLVWIVLLDIAASLCVGSGLWRIVNAALRLRPGQGAHRLEPQQKSGLRAAAFLLVVEIAVILLLTVPSHAVLLSVTGGLFPSSFSASIVPIVAFVGVTLSVGYGLFSGSFHNYRDIASAASHGGMGLKSLLVIYVLAMELYCSVVYVLG